MKILLVEDDPDIADFVRNGLEKEGYAVDTALEGQRGAYMAKTAPYDLIILDNSLPLKNGLDVCSEIRMSGSSVPIIFLSVISDTTRKIEALTRGADDYVTKPFHFEELKARVKALLRRPQKIENSVRIVGDLILDKEKRVAYRENIPLNLTKKEFNLLEYLMRNPSVPASRSMIMEHVWNANSDPFSNTVEVHIVNLRKKINAGDKKDIIFHIPGRGYFIEG